MDQKSKMVLGIMAVAVVAGLGFGAWVLQAGRPAQNAQQTTASPTVTVSPSPEVKVYRYDGQDGRTALAILKERDPNMKMKGEGANAYVTAIDGYEASEAKGEFWALYVNGKMAEVGAGSYVTKAGDKIEWKIDTY